MCVCFHFTTFVSQPSELFLKGQPLNVQNGDVEFWMVQAHVPTLCFSQKRQWLTFQHIFWTRNGSGSHSNTLFRPETAVAHIPTLYFKQKLQWFMFQHFASTSNDNVSHSNTLFQSKTAVPHVPKLCFGQKLQCLIFESCVSVYCRVWYLDYSVCYNIPSGCQTVGFQSKCKCPIEWALHIVD